ncbi:branched-chain amino acid transport system II carrier protein [Bacillus sp. 165]|uniref:branched-chain amino acid transport system II carrier protein n=1 Tax=Bacillus sp. 165 TaxID=1529117 RepID=UPI001ADA9DBD|nr:branched-chain amino acid transport system II carrier protein [Bacillus sp. 165]MBO9128107.1 branched-chain amino acid transport system II carrier protein [Bacillus sp. 165]
MKGQLKTGDMLAVGLMMFALFLGAGNLIFPPLLGQESGTNVWVAIIGFLVTGVGLPLLAVIAIAQVRGDLQALSKRVHPMFGWIFPLVCYLAIGPFFGIPRTGTVSFEMSVKPFLSEALLDKWYILFIYTVVYFAVTWYLSLNPTQLVDWFGKVVTPLLVVIVAVIVGKAVIDPVGEFGKPTEAYAQDAFFTGFIQGFLTMDAISALVLGIVIVQAIKARGVTNNKVIVKSTITAGVIAAIGLVLIYLSLAYVGASSVELGRLDNGGMILTGVVNYLFGTTGKMLLGLAITFACLTTSVGLTSACAEFFAKMFPKFSYKTIVTIICVFSLFVSNLGLTQLIKVTLPVLIAIYPVAIVLVLLSFVQKYLEGKETVYTGAVIGAFAVSILNALESAGMSFGSLSELLQMLPLYSSGIGWIVPSILGGYLGLLAANKNKHVPMEQKRSA